MALSRVVLSLGTSPSFQCHVRNLCSLHRIPWPVFAIDAAYSPGIRRTSRQCGYSTVSHNYHTSRLLAAHTAEKRCGVLTIKAQAGHSISDQQEQRSAITRSHKTGDFLFVRSDCGLGSIYLLAPPPRATSRVSPNALLTKIQAHERWDYSWLVRRVAGASCCQGNGQVPLVVAVSPCEWVPRP